MKRDIRVAHPPAKPLLLYDGECRFCGLWIKRWRQITGEAADYLPFQDASVTGKFPETPLHILEKSIHLIEPDGSVYFGAEAVFRSLSYNPKKRRPLGLYEKFSLVRCLSEKSYSFIANNRPFFSLLTRLGWGAHTEQPAHSLVRWFFLRGLALIYFFAFLSLFTQIGALIGSNGIIPAADTLRAVQQQVEQQQIGLDRHRLFPTLCWWNTSDSFLQVQCVAGIVLSLLALVGVAPALCFLLLWLLYLSLTTIGMDFLSFQWDNLLLETGLLAIFFAPWQLLPTLAREAAPSRLVLWLLRWLMFRLMFESGVVKLLSGDATWKNLTALNFHYETQPLPTWLGFYAHQFPEPVQKFSVLAMFVIELIVPFFIFAPRRFRIFAAVAFIVLQIGIALTGNYCFFNLLTIVLCLPLLDDFCFSKLTWLKCKPLFASTNVRSRFTFHASRFLRIAFAFILISVTALQLTAMFHRELSPPRFLPALHNWLAPLRSVNRYGLFAVMTTSRPEIIIEGSHDGQTWLPYEFKHKPGDPGQRPTFVAPHQPRLDWQMWFAALGTYQNNPWFINFCVRLLQGSPEVLSLLETNPFPDKPPRKIRAITYDYRFNDLEARRRTGEWWKRERKELYCPELQLR